MTNHIQRVRKTQAKALALCDQGKGETELSLQAGDIVHLLAMTHIGYLKLLNRRPQERIQARGKKA